ncbi:hypothetical protein GCM10010390_07450 [Streptomyces mordarskii]|uniref:Uncharacterized protein n=1 Tax=Streptomyces mordarskii TaxID=1226758 RepID=A0ABN1BWD8_9ACTN
MAVRARAETAAAVVILRMSFSLPVWKLWKEQNGSQRVRRLPFATMGSIKVHPNRGLTARGQM